MPCTHNLRRNDLEAPETLWWETERGGTCLWDRLPATAVADNPLRIESATMQSTPSSAPNASGGSMLGGFSVALPSQRHQCREGLSSKTRHPKRMGIPCPSNPSTQSQAVMLFCDPRCCTKATREDGDCRLNRLLPRCSSLLPPTRPLFLHNQQRVAPAESGVLS